MFVELLFTCKNLMTEFAFQGQLFHSADLKEDRVLARTGKKRTLNSKVPINGTAYKIVFHGLLS
jgi:hypothetical protein